MAHGPFPNRGAALKTPRRRLISPEAEDIIDFLELYYATSTATTFAVSPLHTHTMANTVGMPSIYAKSQLLMYEQIAKQYTRLLRLWPTDALRPNLPFTRAIESRALPYGVTPLSSASNSGKTPKSTSAAPSKSDISATTASTHAQPANPQLEIAQITALYSLLENRYAKKYPLSEAVFKPTSAPEHYTKLMEEIERAPQKTWWQAKVDEWKMKIRWQ